MKVSTIYHSLPGSVLLIYLTALEAHQLNIAKTWNLKEKFSKLTEEKIPLQNM